MQKFIGVACLVVGVVLLVWGHDMVQSISSQLQKTFTGSPGDKPMYLYMGGAALCAVGLALIFWKRR